MTLVGGTLAPGQLGEGEIKPELLFLPWGIALVYGVSISFHTGVMAERERAAKQAESDAKK